MGSVGASGKLAILGCIILMVSVAIDPFVQEAISTPLRKVPMADVTVSLGRTQVYDSGSGSGSPGKSFMGTCLIRFLCHQYTRNISFCSFAKVLSNTNYQS